MHNKKGFTLIEILVVVFIIGLLTAIIIPKINAARQKSRDAKRLADINTVASALNNYYADNHAYPNQSSFINLITGTLRPSNYLSSCPKDPKSNATTDCTAATNGWQYRYAVTADLATYYVYGPVELSENANCDEDHVSVSADTSLPGSGSTAYAFQLKNGEPSCRP